jgi:hypothetical protein
MKVTFEIDTHDPDQRVELRQLQQAGKMAALLDDYQEALRERIKYREDIPPEQIKGLEMARDLFISLVEDAGINIEELNN